MKKSIYFLFTLVFALFFSSCSSDDYEFETNNNGVQPTTRAVDEPMSLKLHLCVTYDPSISDYYRFVIFNRITVRPSENPELRYTKNVSYIETDNQRVGSVAWGPEYFVTFNVNLHDVIAGESWLVDVDCRANQGYYVYGDYKVSLYTYDGDTPEYIDSHVCVNAQGGEDFTLSTGNVYINGLTCTYLGENEYYISLHVEPVNN